MPQTARPRGMFIAFEGGEGGGKSTQVQRLVALVESRGRETLATREPGATRIGPAIRSLLLDPVYTGLSARAEALLYAANRAEHVAEVIAPALAQGVVVITDRYVDSSLAYQGAGRPLDAVKVELINTWATGGLLPDLTVVLDIDPVVGLVRAGAEPDRLEAEPLEFHQAVRQGFLALAARAPERYLVVDASLPAEAVAAVVADRVLPLLAAPSLAPAPPSQGEVSA